MAFADADEWAGEGEIVRLMEMEAKYILELTWRERLVGELWRYFSLVSFRILLTNVLILSSAFFFIGIDYSSLDLPKAKQLITSMMLLKFSGAFILVQWIFYKIPKFFMRIYFHMHVRNKFLKWQQQLEENGRFSLLRETNEVYKGLSFFVRNYIYNLGYFTRNDLRLDVKITEEVKEEMVNELLLDCYKWMCCLIHLLFTLFFVWDYVNFFLIAIALIGIAFNFIMAYTTFPLVMNLEILNKIRLDIIKDRKLGMKVMELE